MTKWTPKRIRKLRDDLGMTQTAFGKRLGVTRVYVSYLERGGEKTPGATLSLLLDCVKKDLEGGENQ
jgi:transcriptional regulator with XRE-family HTH domain